MYYSRLRLLGVAGVCLLGVLLCLPNFLKAPSSSLPWRQIHLGLDLKGGSYLLLQLDLKSLEHDRLLSLQDQARQALLDHGLGYRDFVRDDATQRLSFTLRSDAERDSVLSTLRAVPTAVPNEFQVTAAGERIDLVLQHDAMLARARDAVAQSIEIVRRRIDATGAIDPSIAREGDDRIVVELPGVSDPERIKTLLGTTARLTFRLLAPNPTAASPGSTMLEDISTHTQLAVQDHVDVDGTDLTNAGAVIDQQSGGWAVTFQLNSTGASAFGNVTRANVGRRFAIVLDNKVIEAPNIINPITAGSGQITGGFDARSASDLALLLRAGALPAPLAVIEQRSIGPSLGAASIHAGVISLAAGFVLVVAFMVLFYARFGLYADIALLANLVLMVGILSLFQATLTLPGMAGMLLTLGMAVDANILINERIREEVQRGRGVLQALQAGFDRATGTIIDSNATAFLAHVMLFVFGTGPVKNFALTITIGIATTLFTTLVLSRLLIVRWYAVTRPSKLPV
ncbi:protein translocase subunit SecD [Neokomagataea anthophila]|uniref:Protein translocase subunit SecD n=1 Tax=Neokomagataea anthophila TaxID=2826925 RepID=A0ABS5E6W5_9PROT|nr:protein translocase subunit SecD [Neokomagataea anthophila]MBR0559648.1 protein translocase subunit SecD [Neokomagataea anthophila]